MPAPDDITEEGFGYFRGTWFIGRVPISETQMVLRAEADIIEWLDQASSTPVEFEHLATAKESGETDAVPESLLRRAEETGINNFLWDVGDDSPLEGLEIGVAGLSCALSSIRCLTAASCRSHDRTHSWSECPVVIFAAPSWRLTILADLVDAEGCGVGTETERGLVTIYAPSIRQMHGLAVRIMAERGMFRRRPAVRKATAPRTSRTHLQTGLFTDDGETS
jgi:hypothetical protein